MEIERSRELGFCFGVRRAIQMMERAATRYEMVETLGPVVHNQQVVARLEEIGVRVVGGLGEIKGRLAAISAHGVPPEVLQELARRGLEVVDATCPIVHRAQRAARELAQAGFQVVVFGDGGHPETRGVLGWVGEGARAVQDPQALDPLPRRLGILCQTTQNPDNFARFLSALLPRLIHAASEIRIVNTICAPTRRRQEAALSLARRSDLIIVVGSFTSANTRGLASLCSSVTETRQVEAAEDIQPGWLVGKGRVGVAAGASTPDEAIDQVVSRLKELAEATRCSVRGSAST